MFELLRGRGLLDHTYRALQYMFISMRNLGLIPTKKYKPLYYLYSVFLNFNCIIVAPIVFNLGYVMDIQNLSTSQILTSIQATFNVYGVPIKIITIALHMQRIRDTEKMLNKLDDRCTKPYDFVMIRRAVIVGNRWIIIFSIIYGIYGTSTFVSGMFMGIAPVSLYMPFWNWRNSFGEYCLQLAYEFFFFFYLLYHQVVNDAYAVIYIVIIRTHLQLLVGRVSRLCTQEEKSRDENYRELVKCIVDHQTLLEVFETITPVISATLFVQFLVMGAVFGTVLINFLIFADTATKIVCLCYAFAILLQTSPLCYEASCLMENSDELPRAIFHSNWIDQDQRYRKMLIFFMQRSQQTLAITALKFFDINLNTNLSIAKFSFTMYTLIKKMDWGKE